MNNIIVKTNYSEYNFIKGSTGWVLRETRSVKCFRPGSYRDVAIKPIHLTASKMKKMLKDIRENKTIHWVQTK